MQHGIGPAAIVIAAAIFSSAASSPSLAQPKPATPGAVTACSLLMKQDAATALGEAVGEPKSTGVDANVSACEYTGSGLHSIHLNLMRLPPEQASMYRAMCAQKNRDGLAGLGDMACWYNEKHQELQVLKGATFFSIVLRRSGDSTEAAKQVAKSVAGRLP